MPFAGAVGVTLLGMLLCLARHLISIQKAKLGLSDLGEHLMAELLPACIRHWAASSSHKQKKKGT